MFELQEQSPLSYFKQISPTHQYGKVAESTIDRSHPSSSGLNSDSVKVLSWNIAKNNYSSGWNRDFSALIKQYQPDKIFL